MNKNKIVEKISALRSDADGPLSRISKKQYAAFGIILLLVVWGVFIFINNKQSKNDSTQNYTEVDTSKLDFTISKSNCEQKLSELEALNPDPAPENASKMQVALNVQGNCYYELGQYDRALKTFEAYKQSCEKASNRICSGWADSFIAMTKDAQANPPTEERTPPKSEATPEILQQAKESSRQQAQEEAAGQ